MPDQALAGIRVLDLGHHIAGPYCGKLLADYGAEVIKVEKPDGGDPTRRAVPFPNDKPEKEASGLFIYLNNNKQGVTLDFKTDTGARMLKALIKNVDVLIENFSPRVMPSLGLAYDNLKAINPGLVMVSISNFGQSGPYRDYKATELVVQALGGWLLTRGEAKREPIRAGGRLRVTEFIGGMYAAAGTMTAFAHSVRTGIGQHVDISLMEVAACMPSYPVAMNNFPDNVRLPRARVGFIPGIEACKDGYVGVNLLTGQQWVDLCGMMGMEDWADKSEYGSRFERLARREEVYQRMHPWFMARSKEDIFKEGQERRIPVAPVYSTEDMLRCPQHQARGYFVEVRHPVMGKIIQPGVPFKMAETPGEIKRLAPFLGEHNEKVYGELLGYSKEELLMLKQAGVI